MPNTEPPSVADDSIVPDTTLGSRLVNIFVSPSEVFDEVKASPPQPANWLVPLICNIVIGIIYTMVVFSQPTVLQQMRQPSEERLQKMVKQGKLTQKAADQQMAMLDRFMSPTFMKAMGIVTTLVLQAPILFMYALVLWLVARLVFHAQLDYMKAAEAVGLATMISVLNKLIMIPLAVIYGNMYMSLSPVLLLGQFDKSNPMHIALSSLNIIWLWNLTVLAIALARLSGTRFIKAAIWPFGFWALWVAFTIMLTKVAAMIGGQ